MSNQNLLIVFSANDEEPEQIVVEMAPTRNPRKAIEQLVIGVMESQVSAFMEAKTPKPSLHVSFYPVLPDEAA